MTLKKSQNPSRNPITPDCDWPPPPGLVRPRNGDRTGDALGVDKLSGLDGGGKSPKHFTPVSERPRGCKID
jgi:hypothetical protein